MWGSLVGFNLFLCGQPFFSFFKDFVGKEAAVELKNDLYIHVNNAPYACGCLAIRVMSTCAFRLFHCRDNILGFLCIRITLTHYKYHLNPDKLSFFSRCTSRFEKNNSKLSLRRAKIIMVLMEETSVCIRASYAHGIIVDRI